MNGEMTMAQQEGARAIAKYLRHSPSKVRRVAHHLRYRLVTDAVGILQHISHRSAVSLSKVIRSAAANFLQQDSSINEKDIIITKLLVDNGPQIKRLWRRGRGRADILLKRMCHITVYVDRKQNFMKHSRNRSKELLVKELKRAKSRAKNTAIEPATNAPSPQESPASSPTSGAKDRTSNNATSSSGSNRSKNLSKSPRASQATTKSQNASSQNNIRSKKGTPSRSN